jgi:transposase-like protein
MENFMIHQKRLLGLRSIKKQKYFCETCQDFYEQFESSFSYVLKTFEANIKR